MHRSWDGCLREVVGSKEVDTSGLYITTPKRRRRGYAPRKVAVLECGHTRAAIYASHTLRPGTWVICTDCRDGRPVPSTSGHDDRG